MPRLIFPVVRLTLQTYGIAEVFPYEKYATPLLFLIADTRKASRVHEGTFLREVVPNVGQYLALLELHVATYPKILFEFKFLIPPYVLVVSHTIGTASYHVL